MRVVLEGQSAGRVGVAKCGSCGSGQVRVVLEGPSAGSVGVAKCW